jgi:hypothetical protein
MTEVTRATPSASAGRTPRKLRSFCCLRWRTSDPGPVPSAGAPGQRAGTARLSVPQSCPRTPRLPHPRGCAPRRARPPERRRGGAVRRPAGDADPRLLRRGLAPRRRRRARAPRRSSSIGSTTGRATSSTSPRARSPTSSTPWPRTPRRSGPSRRPRPPQRTARRWSPRGGGKPASSSARSAQVRVTSRARRLASTWPSVAALGMATTSAAVSSQASATA